MNITSSENNFEIPRLRPLHEILLLEWKWWLFGAILSFVGASIVMTGWPKGLVPNISYPYSYGGDGLFVSWMIERLREGWIFFNTRSGYPFGSNFLDYPGSDAGSYLVLKIIGLFSGNFSSILNLYFLFGFFITFIATFCGLRALRLSMPLSFVAALLFDFAPFHFLRLPHLFYTWYFVVPIFFHIAIKIFFCQSFWKIFPRSIARYILCFLGCMCLASFGVYYALFGVITIATAAAAMCIGRKNFRMALVALMIVGGITTGVLANVFPNIVHRMTQGTNLEAVERSPAGAEIYGLKMIQLFLPRPDHRVKKLAKIQENYDNTAPLVNENTMASLGVIGSIGFVLLGIFIVSKLSNVDIDDRLSILGILVLILFLFGTIGGLGSIFSRIISPDIRGWNRISIFISYGAVAAFFLSIQIFLEKHAHWLVEKKSAWIVAIPILGLGFYDQTTPACISCNLTIKHDFDQDRNFIAKIEQSLPTGTAIYQLPYMGFPETPALNKLDTYGLAVGFLQSKSLKWSYGGMKGRLGDLFYRSLSKESLSKQLEIIRRLGFSGIYIDRRGYEDNGGLVVNQLSALLDEPPTLSRSDGEVVFFRLSDPHHVDFSGLSAMQIMQRAGYIVDGLGVRYHASLSQGMDFAKIGAPDFIKNISGLSVREKWGRWSDANISPSVRMEFFSPLPKKFVLKLVARPFGVDDQQEVLITLGKFQFAVHLSPGINDIQLPVDLSDEKVTSIDIKPLRPVSPKSLGLSNDSRRLGIGLIKLQLLQ